MFRVNCRTRSSHATEPCGFHQYDVSSKEVKFCVAREGLVVKVFKENRSFDRPTTKENVQLII